MNLLKSLKNKKGMSGAVKGAMLILTLAFAIASVSYIMPVFAPPVTPAPNPTLPASCGIDIALIIDNSGSIDNTSLTTMKTAFKGFVDSFLPNTPTQIAVVSFNTLATLRLDYSSNAAAIKNAIDSVSTSHGCTNWQDALAKAYAEFDNRPDKPDLYVFASDGVPNMYGNPAQGNCGDLINLTSLDAAVTTANTIKTSGIRIVTLGIGGSVTNSSLIAISSADALILSNFSTLSDALAALANDLCGGTVIVKKSVNGVPTSGWHFDLTGALSTPSPANGNTDVNGNVIFDVNISGSTATVNVAETLKNGYNSVSASCNDGQSLPGTTSVANILVSKNGIVNCVFNNNASVCGNNKVESGEQCDDGNTINGDCCSSTCQYESASTVCRASGGVCDPAEQCTGSSATCPADAKSTAVCRPSAGICDVAESCNGVSNTCPTDAFLPSTTQCRASAGVCDVAEMCTGLNAACPTNTFASSGTPCYDGLYCNGPETCDGLGHCQNGTPISCTGNNISGIATCDNNPDSIHFTWDSRNPFTSACVEDGSNQGHCTTGNDTIGHACSISSCGAECEKNSDCLNKCQGLTWKHSGTCLGSCSCNYTETGCSDQIACTVDSCSAGAGCSHTPDNSLCNDNNVCTQDVCDVNQNGCTHTIIDTTAPETIKTLLLKDGKSVECFGNETDVLEGELTDGCKYVKAGTQVVLQATDDKFLGNVGIHWIVWYKVNSGDSWVIDQQGVGSVNESGNVTITLDKDSYHLIEYWSVDTCGNEETHHYELDIVDSKGPLAVKTVGEPKDQWTPGKNGDPESYFYPEETANCWAQEGGIECWQMTTLTPISMECTDQQPHPVGEEGVCFKVDVDDSDKTQEYCGGEYKFNESGDGYCCADSNITNFYFKEDSEHNLKYYCVDALGNKGPEDEEKFKVEGCPEQICLSKKWNLVSVPFTLFNDSPSEVFKNITSDIVSVWTYDNGNWSVWTPGCANPQDCTLTHIKPGWGYWILAKDDGCFEISGSLFSPRQVLPSRDLQPGWNLIGYYGNTVMLDGDKTIDVVDGKCLIPSKPVYCSLYSLIDTQEGFPRWSSLWDYFNDGNDNAGWESLDACIGGQWTSYMKPGVGYWIEMDVKDGYAPATNCIWDSDLTCVNNIVA